ncbi:SusC/RagA family TonB-linked outer membrane protein [Salinimicrobium sp. TIG7-5_MAKvit]|uniref:SusC/RagA family TonB-linked outer membrane protein n=1 Tax=Salinimicrobium sp. TIG7-5_MAKvit TaxID=3121289 RepID=UPI003C6E02C5
MKIKLFILFGFALGLFSQNMVAQDQAISGTITDAQNGMPLPGVTVVEKGTMNGAVTDMDGNYMIDVPSDAVLVFSMVGFTTREITVGDQSTIDVQLTADVQALDEVVVTALGIKREKKSLGYALQEIGGEELAESRETNLANAFTGKVAGLNVVRGGGGPASSSKIILRGNNSLTGDNQPLIIVDGVPMDNFTGASNNDFWNPSVDMGNGLGDLDPENIASMSVLKGASAAALYGARAGNGVILITTKSGKDNPGLGITYNATLGFEEIFTGPEFQNSFGQGSDMVYNRESGSSWGPKIEGQTVENWKGEQTQLRAYHNVDNYFDTGISLNQSLSFSQKFENTSVYSSVGFLNDDSMIPESTLERLNLLTRAVSNFGPNKRWTTDVKVQYINSKAENRPFSGVNSSNAFYTTYLFPRSVNIADFEAAVDEFGNQIWYKPGSNEVNPYWGARFNNNFDSRDRFLMNGSLKYDFTDWLSGEIRAGSDRYTTENETRLYGGSPLTPTGRYSKGINTFNEDNFSILFSAAQDNVFGNFGFAGTLGGNLMQQEFNDINSNAGELEVPNLFSLNNGVDRATVSENYYERKMNSVYGTFQINYGGYLFLDFTGRNDWSSTLSEENRSFFYPSVSTSILVNDVIKNAGGSMPKWITYTKLRASYAQVGNDMAQYQLYNFYNINKDPNGNTIAGRNGELYNPDVKSELIKSIETGFDARLFDNKLGIDFSWYKSNATNQLISIGLNPLSGYSSMRVNAGDIQNKGFELMLTGRILENPDGLSWTTNINYSKNENTLEELVDGVDTYPLGGFDNVSIVAEVGGMYGNIYGTKFRRVEDKNSEFYGDLILNDAGLPLPTNESYLLGNQQPDALLGWTNSFSYKAFELSFMIDGRFGGEIFSGTNNAMQLAGTSNVTVVNGKREEFVVDGVIDVTPEGATSPVYTNNDNAVSHQDYWTAVAGVGNLGITEANVYDATNFRLRNVQLNYNLPKSWIQDAGLQRAKVGISGNNLWMIDSNMNGIDPESVFATGTNAVGFENGSSPTSRSYFFNLTLQF